MYSVNSNQTRMRRILEKKLILDKIYEEDNGPSKTFHYIVQQLSEIEVTEAMNRDGIFN